MLQLLQVPYERQKGNLSSSGAAVTCVRAGRTSPYYGKHLESPPPSCRDENDDGVTDNAFFQYPAFTLKYSYMPLLLAIKLHRAWGSRGMALYPLYRVKDRGTEKLSILLKTAEQVTENAPLLLGHVLLSMSQKIPCSVLKGSIHFN